jgi:hypothetical protein
MSTSRRGFITGCSAAVAAYAGTNFNTLAVGDPGYNEEILVTQFLRGSIEAINMSDPDSLSIEVGLWEGSREPGPVWRTLSSSMAPTWL